MTKRSTKPVRQAERREHYFLVAGNVVIQDEHENVQAIPQNGTVTTDSRNFGVHCLNKGQRALQFSLARSLGELPKVLDVVITNVSYLGHMTASEFAKVPEGQQVQEMDQGVGGLEKAPAEVIDLMSRVLAGDE